MGINRRSLIQYASLAAGRQSCRAPALWRIERVCSDGPNAGL